MELPPLPPPVFIPGNFSRGQGHLSVRVPPDKVLYCDKETNNSPRNSLLWEDCGFFVMGYYGHTEELIRGVMEDTTPPLPELPEVTISQPWDENNPPPIQNTLEDPLGDPFSHPLPPLPVYPAFPCEYCNNDGLTEKIEAELDEVWPDEKKLPPFMPRRTVPLIVLPGSMDPFIPTDKLHLNLGEEEPL